MFIARDPLHARSSFRSGNFSVSLPKEALKISNLWGYKHFAPNGADLRDFSF